jgi:dCMP deaminase
MDVTNSKWTARLLGMAKKVASWSKDRSTKVGAVITTKEGLPVSWGFNGMPMGIDDDVEARHERPIKYKWFGHAEQNAMDLAPNGDLTDCVMFVTFSPCARCAQSIINKKIKTVVVDANFAAHKMPERWQEDMNVALEMLREAGVTVLEREPESFGDVVQFSTTPTLRSVDTDK